MIYFLLIGFIILWIISLIITNVDLLSPSSLICLGYLLAIISCLVNVDSWGVELHANTVLLLLLGVSSFIVTQAVFIATHNNESNYVKLQEKSINVSSSWLFIFCIFNVIVLVLAFMDVLKVTGGITGTFNEMMQDYRYELNYGEESVASPLVVQLKKVSKGISYCLLFIGIKNSMGTNKSFLHNLKYFIPMLIYILITLLEGGRLNIIVLLVAIVFLSYYNYRKTYLWHHKKNYRLIFRILLLLCLFAIIFYLLKDVVGRTTNDNFFDYITKYFGGSIELFDQYLNDGLQLANSGQTEVFPGLAASLSKLGIGDDIVHKSLEFRYSATGVYLGNVYTGMRRYFADLGILGIILFPALMSSIFSSFYYKLKRYNRLTPFRLTIIVVYSYMLFTIVIHAMEDRFFVDLSVGFFIELFIVYLMSYLILKVGVRKFQ